MIRGLTLVTKIPSIGKGRIIAEKKSKSNDHKEMIEIETIYLFLRFKIQYNYVSM